MSEVKTLTPEQEPPAEKVTYGGEPPAPPEEKKPPKKLSKKAKKRIRRIIALAVLAGIAAGGVKFFLSRGQKGGSEVVTNTVQYGSITSTVEGSGLTRAKNSQTITISTAGTVSEVFVTEGQQVSVGDPLYIIDSEAASNAVTKARTNVEGYQKQLKALQKDIAGLNLAPSYPGKLTDVVTLNPGDEISKDQKVATLSDDTRMRLKQYYSYAYDGKIRAGQSVEVSIPALMSTLTGTVEKVNRVTRITDQGSQLFEADILVKNPGTLTKDMTASASVTVDGETVYPYESGKLEYYRTGDLKSTVSGTVISSSLVDYLSVQAGQVLVRIDGEDSENEIFDVQQNLEDAQKTLDEAQQNLDNCSAAAPIDGTVMGLAIQAGDDVAANTAVITIADTSTIVIDATVDERHISYVQAGMSVDIDQWGTPFTGIVDSISLNSKAENGVASYPMTISVDNPDGTLMTGSYVNYSLVASQNDNCLILPIQCVKSVQLDDGSSADVVFVQSDSRPDNAIDLSIPVDGVPDKGYWPVPVETGISDDFNVEIKSGVEEGAVVFTAVQTQSSFG